MAIFACKCIQHPESVATPVTARLDELPRCSTSSSPLYFEHTVLGLHRPWTSSWLALCRGDVVLVESWTEPAGRNGARRDWIFSDCTSGAELGRATRYFTVRTLPVGLGSGRRSTHYFSSQKLHCSEWPFGMEPTRSRQLQSVGSEASLAVLGLVAKSVVTCVDPVLHLCGVAAVCGS
jgi:hypothetical protein